MKPTAKQPTLRPRNAVARSPLLGKGGPHGKTTAAKRRQARIELSKQAREPDAET
jgi:hypothetical protein